MADELARNLEELAAITRDARADAHRVTMVPVWARPLPVWTRPRP
jgi:hypothetical protein